MMHFQENISINKQHGAALILFFVLMIVGFGIFILQSSNKEDRNNEAQTRKALLEAKEALIGFAVSTIHTDNGGTIRMGRLPWPDRNNDPYDGRGDQDTSAGMPRNRFMLGNFPWHDDEFDGTNTINIGVDVRDGSGERLWYAVSPNLVRYGGAGSTAQPVFDPSLAGVTTDWLTVYVHNINGAQIQQINNVAFVLLAPGASINGQNRNGIAPPANRYLDVSGVRNNADAIDGVPLDFVMAPKNETFNDVLIYVTRDELIAKVYERVFNEIRRHLNLYYATNNFFPYAGDSTAISPALVTDCVNNNQSGTIAIGIGSCASTIDTSPAPTPPATANIPVYMANWPADITYTVRNDCIESNPTLNCNTIPGVVQLSSITFPNLSAQLP